MNSVTTPHDRLFRSAMADLKVARDFFREYLPAAVKDAVDYNSLTLCQNSYIDQSLKLSLTDVLYKVTLAGEDAYIYLLCEHQSTCDPLMPFRIWKYTVDIWADYLKQNEAKKLPLIIPMVFYTGKSPYSSSQNLKDLINAPPKFIEQILFNLII